MTRALLIAMLLTAPAYGAGLLTCYDGSTAQDHCDWRTELAETPQQQGIGPSAPANMTPWALQGVRTFPPATECASSDPQVKLNAQGYCEKQATDWHLLTQSYGGTVSLVKGLTEKECNFARNRALGFPATDEERKAKAENDKTEYGQDCPTDTSKAGWDKWLATHLGAGGCHWKSADATGSSLMGGGSTVWGGSNVGRMIQPGDIRTAECFQ